MSVSVFGYPRNDGIVFDPAPKRAVTGAGCVIGGARSDKSDKIDVKLTTNRLTIISIVIVALALVAIALKASGLASRSGSSK